MKLVVFFVRSKQKYNDHDNQRRKMDQIRTKRRCYIRSAFWLRVPLVITESALMASRNWSCFCNRSQSKDSQTSPCSHTSLFASAALKRASSMSWERRSARANALLNVSWVRYSFGAHRIRQALARSVNSYIETGDYEQWNERNEGTRYKKKVIDEQCALCQTVITYNTCVSRGIWYHWDPPILLAATVF